MHKIFHKYLICSLVLIMLYSCKKSPGPLDTVTIGFSKSVNNGLVIVADEKKYFEEQGLDVEIIFYKTSFNAFEDMLTGNLDMVCVAETPIVYKSFERSDFKIISTVCSSYNDPKIIVNKDSGIKYAVELENTVIGTTRKGQSAHYFLSLFLLKNRIDESTITLIEDNPNNLITKLANGDVDAISIFEPFATKAIKNLNDKALVLSEFGLYYKTNNLITTDNFITTHKDNIYAFMKGLKKAEQLYIHSPKKFTTIINTYFKQDCSDIIGFNNYTLSLDNKLLTSLDAEAHWISNKKLVTVSNKTPDYTTYIMPEFINNK